MALRAKKVKAIVWVNLSLHRINACNGQWIDLQQGFSGASSVKVDMPLAGLAPTQELVSRAGMIRASAINERVEFLVTTSSPDI